MTLKQAMMRQHVKRALAVFRKQAISLAPLAGPAQSAAGSLGMDQLYGNLSNRLSTALGASKGSLNTAVSTTGGMAVNGLTNAGTTGLKALMARAPALAPYAAKGLQGFRVAKNVAGMSPIGWAVSAAIDAPANLFHDPRQGGRGWNANILQNLQNQRDAQFDKRQAYNTGSRVVHDAFMPFAQPVATANALVGGSVDAGKNVAKSVGSMGFMNTLRSFAGKPIPGASAAEVAAMRARHNPAPVSTPATGANTVYRASAPMSGKTVSASVKSATMTKTVPLHVVSVDGKPRGDLQVEIADDPESKRKGLSKRASLPADRGMLFACPGPFWMKDVNFALDIMFMDKRGTVLEHKTMWPNHKLQEWELPRYRSKYASTVYALEAPGGWCRKHGITQGDRVSIDKEA